MKFRFVDKILEYKVNDYITGIKSLSLEEYFLLRPTGLKNSFPPSLIAESLFQLGNFLIFKTFKNKIAYLSMFKKIEFHNQLTRGDVMTMRVEIVKTIEDSVMFNGYGFVGDRKIITGHNCIGTLIDIDKLYNPEKYQMMFESLYTEQTR